MSLDTDYEKTAAAQYKPPGMFDDMEKMQDYHGKTLRVVLDTLKAQLTRIEQTDNAVGSMTSLIELLGKKVTLLFDSVNELQRTQCHQTPQTQHSTSANSSTEPTKPL